MEIKGISIHEAIALAAREANEQCEDMVLLAGYPVRSIYPASERADGWQKHPNYYMTIKTEGLSK